MSAPVTHKSLLDPDGPSVLELVPNANYWKAALGILAGVLVLGGIIAAGIGLSIVGDFGGTVLGQDQRFDEGVAAAIVGGAAIFLGVLVGAAWLVLGAIGWRRRA
jgi:hypothetical protein